MKFTGFASFFVFAVAALADTVAFDETYDNASTSLNVVVRTNPLVEADRVSSYSHAHTGLLRRR
jgi:hypothetical protein